MPCPLPRKSASAAPAYYNTMMFYVHSHVLYSLRGSSGQGRRNALPPAEENGIGGTCNHGPSKNTMLHDVHYHVLYSLRGSSGQGRRNALPPAKKTASAPHAIMWHHTCTMLYDDHYHVYTHYEARRVRGGEMPCPLPGKPHRRHMRLCGIIHALCCMMITITYYTHYGACRVRGGRNALLPAENIATAAPAQRGIIGTMLQNTLAQNT